MVKEGKGHNWYRIGFIYWEAKKIYKREKIRNDLLAQIYGLLFGYFFESTVAKINSAISVWLLKA